MRTETSTPASRRAKKELARRLRSADPGLEVVHPDAAGIDVGNESHYVAVRSDRDSDSPVRHSGGVWVRGISCECPRYQKPAGPQE